MKQAIVVYDSVYGNTEAVAKAIAEGLGARGTVQARLARVGAVRPETVAGNDIIVLGSPNHFGSPTRALKRIIRRLGRSNLSGKTVAVFDTCFEPDRGKATRRMEERLSQEVHGARILAPGLSTVVVDIKGPLREGELARSREFGGRLLADANAEWGDRDGAKAPAS